MTVHTSQFGDVLAAFKAFIVALTFPTSLDHVFPSVVWAEEDAEPTEPVLWPCAIIRPVGELTPDDDNGFVRHKLSLTVEIRQQSVAEDGSEEALFGTQRENTDGALGAGMADLIERLISQTSYLTTSDNAEFLSNFAFQGCSMPRKNGDFVTATARYAATINIT